jgi:hypothetical protein
VFICVNLWAVNAQQKSSTVLGLPTVTAPEKPVPANIDHPEYDIFQNKSGGVTITAYRGTEIEVAIPAAIGGQPVTVIGPRAFAGKNLTSVTVPEGVDTIAFCAFAGNKLERINLPQSLLSIEYEAFAENALAEVALPENLASLAVRAFADNPLEKIAMNEKLTFIGKEAFAGTRLSSITLADRRNLWASQGFELSFINYYNAFGRKAGTYVKAERVWTMETVEAKTH